MWKDIPGYEGAYQASSLGRIRSLDRYVNCAHNAKRKVKGRVLKPGRYSDSGHVSVVLGKGTNGKPVHQLIMLTFKGERPEGLDIRHLDGNPLNNRIENLTYGTRTENILDVYHNGGRWRKLTKQQVKNIRVLIARGIRIKDIAEIYNVSDHTIYNIRKRRIYDWIP
ncbi:NUMOD4 domain-containing protein [Tissierella praeacuta]|uniref:NUMOD4 domain-containing protein n=1 Tax=Tissierella praeacuta TaxID=43131 RepID=UPI002FD96C5C